MGDSRKEFKIWIKTKADLLGYTKLAQAIDKVKRKTNAFIDNHLMGFKRAVGATKLLGDATRKVAAATARMGSKMFGVLSKLTGKIGLVSAAFLGIGSALAHFSLKAAGDIEMLKAQLGAVLPTAEAVKKAFKESMDFSVKTPFTPAEIVQTRIALEGVGIAGAEAVKSISEAAAALDRNLLDVASAVKSLETEPLRNLGIALKRQGDSFVFSFKNKMGDAMKVSAKSFADAQQKLLGIFDTKFKGGVEKMAQTFKGLKSTLAGVRQLFFAELGNGFLPQAKQIVQDIIDLLNKGIDSGKIKALGEAIGKKVQQIRNFVVEIASGINSVQDLKVLAETIGDWLKAKLIEGGHEVAAYLSEKAPIIGDIIGRAVIAGIKGGPKERESERRASQDVYGTESPGFWQSMNPLKWGEFYSSTKQHSQGMTRRDALRAEGERARAQVDISPESATDFWSIYERNQYEADKAAAIADVLNMAASGMSIEEIDGVIRSWKLNAEEIGVLMDALVDSADSATEATAAAEESAKASDEMQQATAKSLDATTASHTALKTTMEQATVAAQKTTQVAERSTQMLGQSVAQTEQLRADQAILQMRLDNLEFQIAAMKV